jgi:hypothetical protein
LELFHFSAMFVVFLKSDVVCKGMVVGVLYCLGSGLLENEELYFLLPQTTIYPRELRRPSFLLYLILPR